MKAPEEFARATYRNSQSTPFDCVSDMNFCRAVLSKPAFAVVAERDERTLVRCEHFNVLFEQLDEFRYEVLAQHLVFENVCSTCTKPRFSVSQTTVIAQHLANFGV